MELSIPLISVLMSVYNEPLEWVKQAIDSILTQTFTDFEFIIINDKPDREELEEFLRKEAEKDPRITVHANSENIGLTKSLNVGLKLCRGKYIARMDADDISMSTRFAKQVAFMDTHPECGIIGSWVKRIGRRKGIVRFRVLDKDIRIFQTIGSPFDHPATLMRTDILRQNNIEYDESLKYAQDRKLWYLISKVSKMHNIPEILFCHRYNSQQVTLLHGKEQRNNVKKIRREIIHDLFLSKFGTDFDILHAKITSSFIRKIRHFVNRTKLNEEDNKEFQVILSNLYLSLDDYNLKTLLFFLKSLDYTKKGWNIKSIAKVLIKHIYPKKFLTTGIRLED